MQGLTRAPVAPFSATRGFGGNRRPPLLLAGARLICSRSPRPTLAVFADGKGFGNVAPAIEKKVRVSPAAAEGWRGLSQLAYAPGPRRFFRSGALAGILRAPSREPAPRRMGPEIRFLSSAAALHAAIRLARPSSL